VAPGSSRLLSHGAVVLVGIFVLNIGNYAFYAAVARIVGVQAYGTIAALFSALFLMMGLSSIVATIVAKLSAQLWSRLDRERVKRLSDVTGSVAILCGIVLGLSGLLSRDPIARFFALRDPSAVVAMSIALPFVLVVPIQRAVFAGTELYQAYAISNVIEGALKALSGSLLAVVLGAAGALYGVAVASFTAWIYAIIAARRAFGSRTRRLDLEPGTIQATSGYIAVMTIAMYAMLYADTLLVKRFFPAEDAGLYAAAALVGRTIYVALGFIPVLVLPKATSLAESGRSSRGLLTQALGVLLALATVALIACCVQPERIVTLLSGAAFAAAAQYVPLYAFAACAIAIANVIAMSQIGNHSYAFVVPLALVAGSQIASMVLFHSSIAEILRILCCGNLLAVAACCYRLDIFGPLRPALEPEPAALARKGA